MSRMTLMAAARLAARTNRNLRATIVNGGLGNGRSEDSLTIFKTIINDHVTVEQDTTSDQIFVTPEQAEAIIVKVEI